MYQTAKRTADRVSQVCGRKRRVLVKGAAPVNDVRYVKGDRCQTNIRILRVQTHASRADLPDVCGHPFSKRIGNLLVRVRGRRHRNNVLGWRHGSFWPLTSGFVLKCGRRRLGSIPDTVGGMGAKSSSRRESWEYNLRTTRELRSSHGTVNENTERGDRTERTGSRIFLGSGLWGRASFGCRGV